MLRGQPKARPMLRYGYYRLRNMILGGPILSVSESKDSKLIKIKLSISEVIMINPVSIKVNVGYLRDMIGAVSGIDNNMSIKYLILLSNILSSPR
jgi:hypothetical protein